LSMDVLVKLLGDGPIGNKFGVKIVGQLIGLDTLSTTESSMISKKSSPGACSSFNQYLRKNVKKLIQ
jgi:hypothetical protein